MAQTTLKRQFFSLTDDTANLHVIITKSAKDNMAEILSKKEEDYPLREVTKKELLWLRAQKEAGFVLKIYDKYYYTQIPADFNLLSSSVLGDSTHCCKSCPYFSTKADCDGGCSKVRDATPKEYRLLGAKKGQAIILSKRIEKYDFISLGCETFHTRISDAFIVSSCTRYEKWQKSKKTKKQKKQ